MGERIFEIKFVDHSEKMKLCVCAVVHSGQHIEWEHREGDIEAKAEWLKNHIKWECALKHAVCEQIKERFPLIAQNIHEYRLVKECSEKKHSAINLNRSDNETQHMLRTKVFEMCKMKKVRGPKPETWDELKSYQMSKHVMTYILTSDEGDMGVRIGLTCEYNIPITRKSKNGSTAVVPPAPTATTSTSVPVAPTSVSGPKTVPSSKSSATAPTVPTVLGSLSATGSHSSGQMGGRDWNRDEDYDKYMKYKKKYLEEKNKRAKW